MPEKIVYPRIYVVGRKPRSECEFFEVKERDGGFIAVCRVLGRPLTAPTIEKCERYWQDCPFRRLATRIESRG